MADASREEPQATISDVIDAVVLYDGPILDHRFTELVSRYPHEHDRERLLAIPTLVTRGARVTRRAAHEWERVTSPVLVDDVVFHAEKLLLEAFLDSAESQIRLKAFLARHAPTQDVRQFIEDAIAIHRDVTSRLRHALSALPTKERGGGPLETRVGGPLFAQGEDASGDLRGQVESAIRAMRDGGKSPRTLVVSHVALRHLRDQGCFRKGETSILDVPVTVDFAWNASEFALQSYDTVAMEEIVRGDRANGGGDASPPDVGTGERG